MEPHRLAYPGMLLGATALVLGGVVAILPQGPIADETVHFLQAQMFARGERQILPELATWPGTHLLVAASLTVFGLDSLAAARATIVICALLCVGGYYALATHYDPENAAIKSAQFFTLPVVLPYCVLVYTDIPALAALIWMLYGTVKQKFALFCVAAILAVLFRQSNIVWLVAGCALYLYYARIAADEGRVRTHLYAFAVASVTLWLVSVGILGGVALGSAARSYHFLRVRGLPNIEFALGLGGLLFLPILTSQSKRILILLRRRWVLCTLVTALFFVGLTFLVKQPDNTHPAAVSMFIRNGILHQIANGTGLWVFAGWVALSGCALVIFPFVPEAAKLKVPLIAVAAVSLLPLWLIEQRYYIALYGLFNLLRRATSPGLERAQLAMNVVLSIAAIYLIAFAGRFL